MESLRDELEKSRNFTVLVLICTILAVYGGTSFSYGEGTWFYFKSEFSSSDESDNEFESETYYTIGEIKVEGNQITNGTKTSLDEDYNYRGSEFREIEEVIEVTKNWALVSIVLSIALFALVTGLFTGQFEKDKAKEYLEYSQKVCLGLIVVCLLNAANFASDFPDALREDSDNAIENYCGIDEDIPELAWVIGGCRNSNTGKGMPGAIGTFEAKWHPGPAFAITFVMIPALATIEYYRLKEISQRGLLIEYEPASGRKVKDKLSIPGIVPVFPVQPVAVAKTPKAKEKTAKSTKKGPKFKPKRELVNIECPSCDAVMTIPKLNKMQEVKCKDCGLSGEIEV